MIRKLGLALACATMLSTAANAAVVVDNTGTLDASYGAAKSTVSYNPTAPTSNFGTPTPENHVTAYSIYLHAENGFVYGFLQANTVTGLAFANLYWDVEPGTYEGTDVGFELNSTTQNLFVPGGPNAGAVSGITVFSGTNGTGTWLEFAIPNYYFTTKYPSIAAGYTADPMASVGTEVTLGLSQSFGYSVAGGATYGNDRLGTVTLAAAVPEPGTWAMMIGGFGLMGGLMRRRKGAGTLATA